MTIKLPLNSDIRDSIHLNDCIGRWSAALGLGNDLMPSPLAIAEMLSKKPSPCLRPVDVKSIDDWERRHGYSLPNSLRVWLSLSNGFYLEGPFIHPLSAIGPMVPFARVPELLVQPESWFELGNPNVETVCIDLGYRWPGENGGHPIFTSGDDRSASPPRIIASSFEAWFLELLRQGGREYWFDPGFQDLGHPWQAHKRFAPAPPLPEKLQPLAREVIPLLQPGTGPDDRSIADTLGITLSEVELIFRHLQHDIGYSLDS